MPREDRDFLNKALAYFNLPKVAVLFSPSVQKWPDIWCYMRPPTIVVTGEWARQALHERRKRLVHEVLHFKGLQHSRQGKLLYSTYPARDTYSRAVYKQMLLQGNPTLTLPTASDMAKFRVTTKQRNLVMTAKSAAKEPWQMTKEKLYESGTFPKAPQKWNRGDINGALMEAGRQVRRDGETRYVFAPSAGGIIVTKDLQGGMTTMVNQYMEVSQVGGKIAIRQFKPPAPPLVVLVEGVR